MSKTKEELNELKKEIEDLNKKCRELTEEDLDNVTGGLYTVISQLSLPADTPEVTVPGTVRAIPIEEASLKPVQGAAAGTKDSAASTIMQGRALHFMR